VTPAYLSLEHAAAYLDLTVPALRQRVKRGTIPSWCYTRMGGKAIRFIVSALDEWMQPAERAEALKQIHEGHSTRRFRPRHLANIERSAS